MKRILAILMTTIGGLVTLHAAGCRSFEPVDSFFAHLDRFQPAFAKAFREECGQPDASECKFAWGLDCLRIRLQKDDLLHPYRADCISVSIRGPDGRSASRQFGWTYHQRDRKWHENGFGRNRVGDNSKPAPCDIDVFDLAERVNQGLIQSSHPLPG